MRIQQQLDRVVKVLEKQAIALQRTPSGAEPEEVLVLETVNTIDDFYRALKKIEGLDWLGDVDTEVKPDGEFHFEEEEEREKMLSGRLYMIMSSQRGLQEILRFWRIFKANPSGPRFERGYMRWRDMFSQLKTIRPWGPEDRVCEADLRSELEHRVESREKSMRVELELWFRQDGAKRAEAEAAVKGIAHEMRGRLLAQSCIEAISYHALLLEFPLNVVGGIIEKDEDPLVRSHHVMYVRPCAQCVAIPPDGTPLREPATPASAVKKPQGVPVVGLLDGVPLVKHQRLDGRVYVDDPDDYEARAAATNRVHGTAMASLIVHGELDSPESVTRPIYARPILVPDPKDARRPPREVVPEDVLAVDLFHRAVLRMVEGEAGEPPVAPDVRIINLSVCDANRPLTLMPSPWARLLDYLAAKYKLLFVVSAGNQAAPIELACPRAQFTALKGNPGKLEEAILQAVANKAYERRLLSPAEAINALTVGGCHSDSSSSVLGTGVFDPFSSQSLPSPFNSQGPGLHRSIKPDVLLPGGRQVLTERLGNTHSMATLEFPQFASAPGHKVAAPGPRAGDLNCLQYMRGTSNAAALATHAAAQLYEVVESLRSETDGERLTNYVAVLIKAMLVHGARWGNVGAILYNYLGKMRDQNRKKATMSRLLGYGSVAPERLMECTRRRTTLLGVGTLEAGNGHRYGIPLPISLSGAKVWRSLVITLAWFSPINARHQGYRRAKLWFSAYGGNEKSGDARSLLQVDRQDVLWYAAKHGTVQHEVFDGSAATPFGAEDSVNIQVNCEADAGGLGVGVPYALAVTLEVGAGIGAQVDIYQEIRSRIRPPIKIAPE